MPSPLENQVSELESKLDNLDLSLVNISDRIDQIDDGNALVQNFLVAERDSESHLELLSEIGEKISKTINDIANVHYPTGIKVVKPGIVAVTSYYQRLIQYTDGFEIDSIFPTAYQNPSATNEGIGYSFGFDIDASSQDYAICSYVRHICRIYSPEGKLKFTIGEPTKAGNVEDKKLYNPVRVMYLPNGNLLILNYNGRGKGAVNNGHISEYSARDGSLVGTRLGFYDDGQSAIGTSKVYRPMSMDADKKDPNLLWVSEYGRGRILLIDMSSWETKDIYYAPEGYSFGTSYGIASLSDGNIALASNTQRSIMIIDRTSKEVIRELDVFTVKSSPDFRDLRELKPGFLIFSSWTSQAVFVIPVSDTTEIPYEQPLLPEDSNLIGDIQFPDYDPEMGVLTRRINDLDDVPKKIVIPYTKAV